jgi:Protein of unknown function (DUF3592)
MIPARVEAGKSTKNVVAIDTLWLMAPSSISQPPTTLPRPPRTIRRRQDAELAAVLLFFVLGGFVCFGAFLVGRELIYWQIETQGQPLNATIDDKNVRLQSSRHGSHNAYYLRYYYTYSGQQVLAEQQVPLAAYNHTKIGEEVPTRVLRFGSWDVSKLDVPRADGNWIYSLILCGIFGTAAVVTAVSAARKRRLVREGAVAAGEIIGLRARRGRSTTYHARYRFTASDGTNHGKQQKVRSSVYNTLSVGTPVTVLYDPANLKRSLAYECCDYELVPAKD